MNSPTQEGQTEVRRYIETNDGVALATDFTREGEYVLAADYDTALATIVTLTRERDDLLSRLKADNARAQSWKDYHAINSLRTELFQARREVASMRPYVQHKPECVMRQWLNSNPNRPPCDCGFAALAPSVVKEQKV